MPVADAPHAPDAPRAPDHEELALTIDHTDEGWWAANVEGTGAFGQGRTRAEALQNVASALRDLNHRPTRREALGNRLRALAADLRDLLPAR